MSGLSLSHYSLYITSTSTFDEIYQDYLYHSIIYIWHLLSHLTTYVWIIFITLYHTSDIYNHFWRHMSGLSLSFYELNLASTITVDDLCLDYLYHTIAYIWHLLPRLTTYVWIIFITLWLTLDIYYHVWRHMSGLSLSHYIWYLTSVWIILITL